MNPSKKTLFISDLHLYPQQPRIAAIFKQLLQQCDASVDALYILGDLFEAWIGDDDDTPFHRDIIAALRTATQKGLPVYFMSGNRDFLIGKKFLRETGCKLLNDEEKISLYGTPVLLMHGDTLCTQDTRYLNWRKKSRNPLLQSFFLNFLPLRVRKKIADKMRAASMRHTQHAQAEIMDVTHHEVERVMRKHNVNVLIHGHTHKPGVHAFRIDNHDAMRIVLDAWHDHGSVLVWESDGKKELRTL